MKNTFKRFLSVLLALITVLSLPITLLSAYAKDYDKHEEIKINGFDAKTNTGAVIVYPNKTDSVRKIMADEFNFRYSKILIFNKDGLLIEAGGDMFVNSAALSGSIQQQIYIPAGGFAVAFTPSGAPALKNCFDTAMDGAMIYNSTMSVIHEVKGSYNETTLTVEYDTKKKSTTAKSYYFVGNSATYVNGTPTKFKGLAQAAGIEIEVKYGTVGSSYLSEFADENHKNGRTLRTMLNVQKYDYVVLQDAGSCVYTDTKPAVAKLLPLIEEKGAKALLYMRYSAASNPEDRLEGAQTHNENYSRLAKEYSLPCAPAADAFIICTEKYPDINLYSDDNSHHSKEGSYLIACTMLYSYLGVDPRGNSYTAQMPDEVAKALQECAYIACTEGYRYNGEEDVYTDKKGNVFENIAYGKEYTATGEAYDSDNWTDTAANGKPIGKLTDGYIAKSGEDGYVGCYKNAGHSITIDLGAISQVRAIKTDLFGNEGWGITDPKDAKISVAVSNDGTNFTDLGEAQMSDEIKPNSNWVKRDFLLELGSPVMAKYVRVTYNGGKFNWSSEISVYGKTASTEEISDTEAEISETTDDDVTDNANASIAWLYWLIGAVTVACVAVAAFLISKVKK